MMDIIDVLMVAAGFFGAFFLGRFSTQGKSWESAYNTINKACNNWREIAAGWEEEAEKWRRAAEEMSNE